MRKITFLLVVALAVAFLGLALVAYGLPKDKEEASSATTTIQAPVVQKSAVKRTYLRADDMDNINAATPADKLAPYSPPGIGAQRPLYPTVNGVPYVNVRHGIPETGGSNNYMRRSVKASPSGVVHMAYRIFDADTGSGDGSFGDTVYNPADSSTNGIYFFNSYDCGGSNALQCSYTGSNGKCYEMARPPDLPETRVSRVTAAGGLFVRPSGGQPVVYGRRSIERTDVAPHGVYSTRGWMTSREGAECTPLFTLDTSYTAITPTIWFDPVMHPIDDNVWLAVFAYAGDPNQLYWSLTTDAGVSWSALTLLGAGSPFYNDAQIASNGNTVWVVVQTDPADFTAIQTTERPCYIKGTYGGGTITWSTIQDITGPFEQPGFLSNFVGNAATNVGDTLIVAWTDWNNYLGNGFPGPGGHVHSAIVYPGGGVETHKVANINIDGRNNAMSTTTFGLGVDPWGEIYLSYDPSKGNLYCLWSQPPDDGSFDWADYEATGTLGVHDIFRSVSPSLAGACPGKAWDNPENITKTNNPGCSGLYGDECANEWWFSADDRVSNDTVAIVAVVGGQPGLQETAEFRTTPDPGVFTRSRDIFRLYKMPADTAKKQLRADLNSLPTDTLKLFQLKTEPGHAPFNVDVKLENIGLLDFFLDSLTFDPALNSGGLVTTSNAVNGQLVNIGTSYPFHLTFNASGVPFTKQGLHTGLVHAYLRTTTAPSSPEGVAASTLTLDVNVSLYVVQTLCVNRKVRIHSGSNTTDIGSQGTIKDQAGNGLNYAFDQSDRFYDGGPWIYRNNLNGGTGVVGVPRKTTRQLFSTKFWRCLMDVVLDSTLGTGPYYNLYGVSVATDLNDTNVIVKSIFEQSTHADSSDFLVQTVKIWNVGPKIDTMAYGQVHDIDLQGGPSSAAQNVTGDTSVTYNGRKFWLGFVAGNDVAVDTCTPNNGLYGVVILPNGSNIGNPGDSIRPVGAVMFEQQAFNYNQSWRNPAGGDSMWARWAMNLNVVTSAPRRQYDTLTGAYLDTITFPYTVCGGATNPNYKNDGPPFRNDEGYMAVAGRRFGFAPSTEVANLVGRYGMEGAAAQLASSVDTSFKGTAGFTILHIGSVSGLPDLMDHAVKAIDWAVKHAPYQTGPAQIDTAGQSHYNKTARKGDLNFTGAITGADVGQEILYLFAGFRTFTINGFPTAVPFCVADVDGNGATSPADLAKLIFGFAVPGNQPGPLCPTCLRSCGF